MRVLAIDIGGTAIKIGLSDLNGNVEQFNEYVSESEKGGQSLVDKIMKIIETTYRDFQAIGISTAGQVDSETGTIVYANENIPNYTGMRLKERFEIKFGVPVKVENDVNAAALGEKHFGVGKKHDDFLCLTYGTGIGGAIMVNAQIYKGYNGIAGEFGHILLHPNGHQCNCGKKGCYEQYGSTTALVREAQKVAAHYSSGKEIFKYVSEDTELQQVLNKWTRNICYGLVSLIHIFNPPLIILGGGIMEQEQLVSKIRNDVKQLAMDSFSDVKIVGASLGNRAGILGAVALHLSQGRSTL